MRAIAKAIENWEAFIVEPLCLGFLLLLPYRDKHICCYLTAGTLVFETLSLDGGWQAYHKKILGGLMAQKLLDGISLNIPTFGGATSLLGGTAGMQVGIQKVEQVADKMVDQSAEIAFGVALGLLILVGGWLVSRWLASRVQRLLQKAHMEETFAAFLGSLTRYTVFFVCSVVALRFMGVDKTSLLAVLGATGLAVAFALRNTVSHIAAGVMLMVSHPFRVGDYIAVGNFEGTVKRLTLFNTELNTVSQHRVFIPNSQVWENVLINHTYNDVRVVELRVTVGYGDAVDDVRKVILETMQANPMVLHDVESFIGVETLGDYGIGYLMRFSVKTDDYGAVRYRFLGDVQAALIRAGMTIPYPTHVVQMGGVPLSPSPLSSSTIKRKGRAT